MDNQIVKSNFNVYLYVCLGVLGVVFTQGTCGKLNKLGTSPCFPPCLSSPYATSFQGSLFASHLAVNTRIADGLCLTCLWVLGVRVRASHSHIAPQPELSPQHSNVCFENCCDGFVTTDSLDENEKSGVWSEHLTDLNIGNHHT